MQVVGPMQHVQGESREAREGPAEGGGRGLSEQEHDSATNYAVPARTEQAGLLQGHGAKDSRAGFVAAFAEKKRRIAREGVLREGVLREGTLRGGGRGVSDRGCLEYPPLCIFSNRTSNVI